MKYKNLKYKKSLEILSDFFYFSSCKIKYFSYFISRKIFDFLQKKAKCLAKKQLQKNLKQKLKKLLLKKQRNSLQKMLEIKNPNIRVFLYFIIMLKNGDNPPY